MLPSPPKKLHSCKGNVQHRQQAACSGTRVQLLSPPRTLPVWLPVQLAVPTQQQ